MKYQLKDNKMWHDRTLYFCWKIFFFIYFSFQMFGCVCFTFSFLFCATFCLSLLIFRFWPLWMRYSAFCFLRSYIFFSILRYVCIIFSSRWSKAAVFVAPNAWTLEFGSAMFFLSLFLPSFGPLLFRCWYVLLCVLVCLYAKVSREIYVCSRSAFKIDLYLNVDTW